LWFVSREFWFGASPKWEERGATLVVCVKAAKKGLAGYGKWKNVRKNGGESAERIEGAVSEDFTTKGAENTETEGARGSERASMGTRQGAMVRLQYRDSISQRVN
jgi:hypothetical protein